MLDFFRSQPGRWTTRAFNMSTLISQFPEGDAREAAKAVADKQAIIMANAKRGLAEDGAHTAANMAAACCVSPKLPLPQVTSPGLLSPEVASRRLQVCQTVFSPTKRVVPCAVALTDSCNFQRQAPLSPAARWLRTRGRLGVLSQCALLLVNVSQRACVLTLRHMCAPQTSTVSGRKSSSQAAYRLGLSWVRSCS